MRIGDSITRGFDGSGADAATYYNGDRDDVDLALIAAGYTNVQWLGTQANSTASYVPTRLHEGVNGDSCADKLPGLFATNAAGYTTSPVDTIFGTGNALQDVQVIILRIGTNAEHSGTFATNHYNLCIEMLTRCATGTRLHLETIFSTGSVTARNNAIIANANALANLGYPVTLTTAPGDSMTGADLVDTIHPTDAGYTKLGGLVAPSIIRCIRGR